MHNKEILTSTCWTSINTKAKQRAALTSSDFKITARYWENQESIQKYWKAPRIPEHKTFIL